MANAELRRLMQLKKLKTRKVDHPLAKYNNLDQLVCVICTKVVKDESVWNAHLQSKKHKENVLLLKSKVSKTSSSTNSSSLSSSSSQSSKNSYTQQHINKNSKSQLPSDFFDQQPNTDSIKNTISSNDKPKSILKGSKAYVTQYAIGNTSDISIPNTKENVNSNNGKTEDASSSRKRKAESSLPDDFFDSPKKEKESSTETTTTNIKEKELSVETVPLNMKEKTDTNNDSKSKIPEGFFDDPKKDAEARNVVYKDPKEKEWEMFQKMIEEETRVAETIQEEEDEEAEMQKDLTELNKMKSCLSRVKNLKSLMKKEKERKIDMNKEKLSLSNDTDGSGDSDEDVDSIFDWRAKMA